VTLDRKMLADRGASRRRRVLAEQAKAARPPAPRRVAHLPWTTGDISAAFEIELASVSTPRDLQTSAIGIWAWRAAHLEPVRRARDRHRREERELGAPANG
jgi:hypothetical protein